MTNRKSVRGPLLITVWWLVTAWNMFQSCQNHQQKVKEEIQTTLHEKKTHKDIEVTEIWLVSPEQMDDDNGYPVGSITINHLEKDTVLNQVYSKYKEIFGNEDLNISIDFYKQVEDILQSAWNTWKRLCFETQMIWEKRVLSKAYIYQEPKIIECKKRK